MPLFKKSTSSRRTTSPTPSKTTSKSPTHRSSASTKKGMKPQKVYRNEQGQVIYRQSTDKIGDVLVNPAGVKYKIIGESFHAPTGYDDGKLKVRILTLKPTIKNGKSFEMGDSTVAHARKNGIFKRLRKSK